MAAKWKRSDELVWEELGSETLVVSPRSGARWSLNAAASAIWKLCDGSRNGDDIAGAFARAKDRSLCVVCAEICAFCDALAGAGLLRRAPSEGSPMPVVARFCGSLDRAPAYRVMGLAGGPRRRPSPRGNSGPG